MAGFNFRFLILFFLLVPAHCIWALDEAASKELAEIIVSDEKQNGGGPRGLKKSEVNRVENLNRSIIQQKRATTFAQVIDNERGIDTQTACAFCGAKRISINGLKGEHTTLLVDGVPLHSAASGFYGIESIPLEGIEAIDIYRGSGAALSAPEAIGGVIDIVSVDPFVPAARSNLTLTPDGLYSFDLGYGKSLSESWALFVGTNASKNSRVDGDHNGVTEFPEQRNLNFFGKMAWRLANHDEASLRFSRGELKTFGGSANLVALSEPSSRVVTSDDFLHADVRQRYIGDNKKIADYLTVRRDEMAFYYNKKLPNADLVRFDLAEAEQKQSAIYSHGYDYQNQNRVVYARLDYQRVTERHIFNLGLDGRAESLQSDSEVLYKQNDFKRDDFKHQALGLYFQNTFTFDEKNEWAWSIRSADLLVDWPQLDHQINESLLVPRVHFKHLHNAIWTSRLGLGLGYRAPLIVFDSQHGTSHDGFLIEASKIERAESLMYSLLGQRLEDAFEFSVHWTKLQHMVYGQDRVGQNLPTLFVNADEDFLITVYDLSYGRRLTPSYQLEAIIEFFSYPTAYKKSLPVAAQEKRMSIRSTWEGKDWAFKQNFNIVFAQDLTDYGYDQHYNIAYTDNDILSPSFGESVYQDQKWQKAPSFLTVDLFFNKEVSSVWSLELQVFNLLDYTQTGAGDSPLAWAQHGDHFHLDNFHIWGPLEGRRFFLSLSGDF